MINKEESKVFTENEYNTMVKNIKSIFEFVRTNICPYLRTTERIEYWPSNWRESGNPNLSYYFVVDPGKNGTMAIWDTNSYTYYFDNEYDRLETKKSRAHYERCRNFWEYPKIMFLFLQRWPVIKMDLMDIIEKQKK